MVMSTDPAVTTIDPVVASLMSGDTPISATPPSQDFSPERGYVTLARIRVSIMIVLLAGGLILGGMANPFGSLWITGPVLAAVFVLLAWWLLSYPVWAWRRLRLVMAPDRLTIRSGVVWQTTSVVPRNRLQFVEVTQGPLERLLGLGTLTLHTAGTTNSVVVMPGLDHTTATGLKEELLEALASDSI